MGNDEPSPALPERVGDETPPPGIISSSNLAAYAAESSRLRAATTQEQFVRSMEGRRQPFGGVLSRKFIGAAFTRKLTGAPDGHYESILFRTAFAHKSVAAERVILSQESGGWRVVDCQPRVTRWSTSQRSGERSPNRQATG